MSTDIESRKPVPIKGGEPFFRPEQRFPIPTTDLLTFLLDHRRYDPERPVWHDVSDPRRTISGTQGRGLIRKLVAGLRAAGLKRGDAVCVHSFNDIYYSILFLGIIAAGGIFTGTNPSYTSHELVHHLNKSKASIIIAEPELLDNVLDPAAKNGIDREHILAFDHSDGQAAPPGFKSWRSLLDHGEEDWIRFDNEEESKTTEAARMFSSGTTGLPKAAMISHHNFIAQHLMALESMDEPNYPIRRLDCLPEFHMGATPPAHVAPLRAGYTSYIMRRFDAQLWLSSVEKYQITDVLIVPAMVSAIILSPHAKSYSLKSLRCVLIGAAPLSLATQMKFRALLDPKTKVTQGYGMTEATSGIMRFHPWEDDTTASVGRPIPNLEVLLLDDNGKNISGYNTRGEVCIRGPNVTPGYLSNPTANEGAFVRPGNWFKTGDIGYCDAETKKWYIVDRKKDLIKVRGFQVAPAEIEAILNDHPGIGEVAVVGVPDGGDGELPLAFVVRRAGKEGQQLTENELKEFVAARLAKYKRLEGGVRFLEMLPRNTTGKILKKVLQETAKSPKSITAKI